MCADRIGRSEMQRAREGGRWKEKAGDVRRSHEMQRVSGWGSSPSVQHTDGRGGGVAEGVRKVDEPHRSAREMRCVKEAHQLRRGAVEEVCERFGHLGLGVGASAIR